MRQTDREEVEFETPHGTEKVVCRRRVHTAAEKREIKRRKSLEKLIDGPAPKPDPATGKILLAAPSYATLRSGKTIHYGSIRDFDILAW
jgi:hypothetical protein